jgi:hypothetical protein
MNTLKKIYKLIIYFTLNIIQNMTMRMDVAMGRIILIGSTNEKKVMSMLRP